MSRESGRKGKGKVSHDQIPLLLNGGVIHPRDGRLPRRPIGRNDGRGRCTVGIFTMGRGGGKFQGCRYAHDELSKEEIERIPTPRREMVPPWDYPGEAPERSCARPPISPYGGRRCGDWSNAPVRRGAQELSLF